MDPKLVMTPPYATFDLDHFFMSLVSDSGNVPPDFVAAADRFTLLCLTVLFFSVQSLREDCFPISSQFVYICIVLADEPTSLDYFSHACSGV